MTTATAPELNSARGGDRRQAAERLQVAQIESDALDWQMWAPGFW